MVYRFHIDGMVMSDTRVAAIALRPMAHLVPDVLNYDPMVRSDHHSSISNRRAARNAITTLPTRHAAASDKAFPTSAKKQIPHSSDLLAAGSFIHDFRTPPAPETLQESGLTASGGATAASKRSFSSAA